VKKTRIEQTTGIGYFYKPPRTGRSHESIKKELVVSGQLFDFLKE
jgi:hypothetical protein